MEALTVIVDLDEKGRMKVSVIGNLPIPAAMQALVAVEKKRAVDEALAQAEEAQEKTKKKGGD